MYPVAFEFHCHLCGQTYTEVWAVGFDGGLEFWQRRIAHPDEDGAPWCGDCLARMDAVAARLLGEEAPGVRRNVTAE